LKTKDSQARFRFVKFFRGAMHRVHIGHATMCYILVYLWDELGYTIFITTTKEDNMNVEEITLIMDSTKILKDMCTTNHAHIKSLNIELQKLVKVVMDINEDLQKVEKRLNKLEAK